MNHSQMQKYNKSASLQSFHIFSGIFGNFREFQNLFFQNRRKNLNIVS